MTDITSINQERIRRQAASWVARLDRGLNHREERRIGEWLNESPSHADQLVECASIWDLTDSLRLMEKFVPLTEFDPQLKDGQFEEIEEDWEHSVEADFVFDRRRLIIPLAASFLLCAIAFVQIAPLREYSLNLLSYLGLTPSETRSYSTATGENANIQLSDGSQIHLNTNSSLDVDFSGRQRLIRLHAGEAYFAVAKDKRRPFVVATEKGSVTAIGTAFNIDLSQASKAEIIVEEGRIKVDYHVDSFNTSLESALPTTEANLVDKVIYLDGGEKVRIERDRVAIGVERNIESKLAWREGRLIFSGEDLSSFVAEIDRYTTREFVIADPEIASIKVGGYFRTGDMNQLITVLDKNFGVHAELKGNQILLSKAD